MKTFLEYFKDNYFDIKEEKIIYINRLGLTDLIGMEDAKKCNFFDCSNNKLSTLENIKDLKILKDMYCEHNIITSLKCIKNLTNLEIFYCFNNSIKSLEGIEDLINLRVFNCSHNEITSLKGVENLKNLVDLNCFKNKISWIDYIDKEGRKYYIKLPKSIEYLLCDEFEDIEEYWVWFEKNQPAGITRKFNF